MAFCVTWHSAALTMVAVACLHVRPTATMEETSKIVKAKTPSRWASVISIRNLDEKDMTNTRHFCVGTVIEDNAILTSASCFVKKNTTTGKLAFAGGTLKKVIRAGFLPPPGATQTSTLTTAMVVGIFPYDKYHNNKHDEIKYKDIAIVKITPSLSKDISSRLVVKADLAEENFQTPIIGQKCTVAGWGADQWQVHGAEFQQLRKANVEFIEREACNKDYYSKTLPQDTFCAGLPVGNGYMPAVHACMTSGLGDRGAPIFCQKPGSKDRIQMGLVSFSDDCYGAPHPAVYTDIRKYRNWIRETLVKPEFTSCTTENESECWNF